MNQMAGNIAALTSGMTWHVKEGQLARLWRLITCGPAPSRCTTTSCFDKAIPDDLWPHAIEIVKNGAAHFGATTVNVFVGPARQQRISPSLEPVVWSSSSAPPSRRFSPVNLTAG